MTTWPSDNKSDLARIDNANDTLGRSRREIKRGIDNVNAIIDTFDLNSINQNQVLVYRSGQWVPETLAQAYAIIKEDDWFSGYYLNIVDDPFSILSLDSANELVITQQGTYYIEQQGEYTANPAQYSSQPPGIGNVVCGIRLQVDNNTASIYHNVRVGGSSRTETASEGTTSHVVVVDSASTGKITPTRTSPYYSGEQRLSWIIYKLA